MKSGFARYLEWCSSKHGRKVCNGLFIALNIGTFSALYCPQTFFLKNYQNFVQLYHDQEPVPVPENIKSLIEEVFDDLDIHKLDRKLIKPFMCFGFDTLQAGIPNMKTGGILGIPINFTFTSTRDLAPERLLINNKNAEWSRDETADLVKALILSQEAKKFAIAREILNFQESTKLCDGIIASALFTFFYSLCQGLKQKYNLYQKSLSSRVFLYTAFGFSGISLYFIQKDFFEKQTEKHVDEKLAEVGPAYVKGGHEFYSQLLTRNIAHRKLLDKNGHELFTENGDPAYFIRQKTTPITKRKARFESMITKFVQEQEKNLNSDFKEFTGDVDKA